VPVTVRTGVSRALCDGHRGLCVAGDNWIEIRLAEDDDDDRLLAVFIHELAHAVLKHWNKPHTEREAEARQWASRARDYLPQSVQDAISELERLAG